MITKITAKELGTNEYELSIEQPSGGAISFEIDGKRATVFLSDFAKILRALLLKRSLKFLIKELGKTPKK